MCNPHVVWCSTYNSSTTTTVPPTTNMWIMWGVIENTQDEVRLKQFDDHLYWQIILSWTKVWDGCTMLGEFHLSSCQAWEMTQIQTRTAVERTINDDIDNTILRCFCNPVKLVNWKQYWKRRSCFKKTQIKSIFASSSIWMGGLKWPKAIVFHLNRGLFRECACWGESQLPKCSKGGRDTGEN